jgi:hypothetical protein
MKASAALRRAEIEKVSMPELRSLKSGATRMFYLVCTDLFCSDITYSIISITCDVNDSIDSVMQRMMECKTRHMLVLENGRLPEVDPSDTFYSCT